MARKHNHPKREKTEKEPPITHGEVTEDNPSGIEAVSEEHAMHVGQLRGFGGAGADGATVAGPVVHVATEGGTKPLPIPESEKIEEKSDEQTEEEKAAEEAAKEEAAKAAENDQQHSNVS